MRTLLGPYRWTDQRADGRVAIEWIYGSISISFWEDEPHDVWLSFMVPEYGDDPICAGYRDDRHLRDPVATNILDATIEAEKLLRELEA